MNPIKRVGLIVPSTNTTIETELPAMLRRADLPVEFSFHSSRAVLHNVDAESLARMVADGDRCVAELADAHVDVFVYGCLVAIMSAGPRAHEDIEARLAEVARERTGSDAPLVSSAGSLIRTLQREDVARVAIITPYMPELTARVAAYIEDYGIEVVDSLSLAVADNVEVGRLDPERLPGHARGLDLSRADLLIASCCVQMPSLPVLDRMESDLGLPVISAATAMTAEVLDSLGLARRVPRAGALLRTPLSSAPSR
jgi:maleate isomerase